VDKYELLLHASLFHNVGLGFENLDSKEMAERRNKLSGLIYVFCSLLSSNELFCVF